MAVAARTLYSCNNSVKAGGLVPETEALFAAWDDLLSAEENLDRAVRENRLGKGSRKWLAVLLGVLRRRYLVDPQVMAALLAFVRAGWPREPLRSVLYYHTAQVEPLLHDVVTEVLAPLRARGRLEVGVRDVAAAMTRWAREGRTDGPWSDGTVERAVRGVLTTLRDFGILEGKAGKRLAPAHLPLGAFAYIAFALFLEAPSGQRVLHHPSWRLFFLEPEAVERLLMEAHQDHLLDYRAAGSIIRLEFPAELLPEYARALAERPY